MTEAGIHVVRTLLGACLVWMWCLAFRGRRKRAARGITFWAGLAILLAGAVQRIAHVFEGHPPLHEMAVALVLTGVVGLIVFWLSTWLPRRRERLWGKIGPRAVPFLLASAAVVLAASGSAFIFQHSPVTADESAFVFQAKLFSKGKLWAESPPLREFFQMLMTINDGRWHSRYFLGHQLVLCGGLLLGSPYVATVFLAGLTVLTVYYLGREVADERVGRCAGLLALVSPYFIFNYSTLLSHTSCMLFMGLFVLFYIRSMKQARGLWAAGLAGAFLGAALNVRPYTAFAMSVPFVVYSLILTFQGWRFVRRFIVMTLAFGVFVGVFCLYNYMLTGDPLMTPFEKYAPSEMPGFHRINSTHTEHTVKSGVANLVHNVIEVDNWLLGAPVCLVLCVLALRRRSVWVWVLLSTYASLAGGYVFFWYHGVEYAGPTYHSDAIPLLLVLAACGSIELGGLLRRVHGRLPKLVSAATATAALIVYCAFFASRVGYATFGTRIWRDMKSAEARVSRTPSIIFVRSVPMKNAIRQFIVNSPFLDTQVIYALDLGSRNEELMRAFPARRAYVYDFGWEETRGTLSEIERPASTPSSGRGAKLLMARKTALRDSLVH